MVVTGSGTLHQGTPEDNNNHQMMVSQSKQQRSPSDNRRSNKPIMEKRRRARINNCLNELKALILDAMKKDPARHSKLEKADILEMTVKHLANLQRQQAAMSAAADPNVVNKFRAGFSECASEVGRFPGLDSTAKRRLLQHLAGCITGPNLNKQDNPATNAPLQVHILPSPTQSSPTTEVPIILSNGTGGVQLVPTRLPNGDIALVLPTVQQQQNPASSTVPMLVPIPTRTSSSEATNVPPPSSPVSQTSYSNPVSPRTGTVTQQQYSPPLQKPLSLVVRKNVQIEEQPWRPW